MWSLVKSIFLLPFHCFLLTLTIEALNIKWKRSRQVLFTYFSYTWLGVWDERVLLLQIDVIYFKGIEKLIIHCGRWMLYAVKQHERMTEWEKVIKPLQHLTIWCFILNLMFWTQVWSQFADSAHVCIYFSFGSDIFLAYISCQRTKPGWIWSCFESYKL